MVNRRRNAEGPTQTTAAEEDAAWSEIVENGAKYAAGYDGKTIVDVADALVREGVEPGEAESAAPVMALLFREWEILYSRGWGTAALLALEYAATFALPAPAWAARALSDAVFQWTTAEVRTFDEAIGVERPANWNQAAARAEGASFHKIREAVTEFRGGGAKMDEGLWEMVEERTGIKAATAKRWWYRARRPKSHGSKET